MPSMLAFDELNRALQGQVQQDDGPGAELSNLPGRIEHHHAALGSFLLDEQEDYEDERDSDASDKGLADSH